MPLNSTGEIAYREPHTQTGSGAKRIPQSAIAAGRRLRGTILGQPRWCVAPTRPSALNLSSVPGAPPSGKPGRAGCAFWHGTSSSLGRCWTSVGPLLLRTWWRHTARGAHCTGWVRLPLIRTICARLQHSQHEGYRRRTPVALLSPSGIHCEMPRRSRDLATV
jgi:hypothetical protein